VTGHILAIDPGPAESGFVIVDRTCAPIRFGKILNRDLLRALEQGHDHQHLAGVDHVAIERIASYGMPVGEDVFHTCFWIGRFDHAARWATTRELIKRGPIKLHLCHTSKAKDPNVTQALIDRFAPGVRNKGKGTKAEPGWFYGFAGDVWQASAVAVYYADQLPQTAVPAAPSQSAATSTPAAGVLPAAGTAPTPDGGLF
jgi:hypothetical protein